MKFCELIFVAKSAGLVPSENGPVFNLGGASNVTSSSTTGISAGNKALRDSLHRIKAVKRTYGSSGLAEKKSVSWGEPTELGSKDSPATDVSSETSATISQPPTSVSSGNAALRGSKYSSGLLQDTLKLQPSPLYASGLTTLGTSESTLVLRGFFLENSDFFRLNQLKNRSQAWQGPLPTNRTNQNLLDLINLRRSQHRRRFRLQFPQLLLRFPPKNLLKHLPLSRLNL